MFILRKRHIEGMREALSTRVYQQDIAQVQKLHPETRLYSEDALLLRYTNALNKAQNDGYNKLQARALARAAVLSVDDVPIHPDYAWLNALLDYVPVDAHASMKTYQRVLEQLDPHQPQEHNQEQALLRVKASMLNGIYWIIRVQFHNLADEAAFLFYSGWDADRQVGDPLFHYAFWEQVHEIHVTKRFWPIHSRHRQADQTLAPEIAYLIRVEPGETFEYAFNFMLPMALKLPYGLPNYAGLIDAKDNVQVARTMFYSQGFCWESDVGNAIESLGHSCGSNDGGHIEQRRELYKLGYDASLLHQRVLRYACQDQLLMGQRV